MIRPITAAALFGLLALAPQAMSQTLAPQTAVPDTNQGARPGNEIGTGNSLPRSNNASNTTDQNTRSPIAPNLPTPAVAGGNTRDFLQAARQALVAKRTGEAQQALEMAETRALDRSVIQGQETVASNDQMVFQISAARRALGDGQLDNALQLVDRALQP